MSGCEGTAEPWSPSAMSAVAPTAHTSPTCEIRMLSSAEELVESYRLRYDVYSSLGYLQRLNAAHLDIDEYDSSSIPFGAFDTDTGEMIGTLRVVTTHPQLDYDYLIRYIVASCSDDDLVRQAWGPQPHALPSIVSDDIDRQIDDFNVDHLDVGEMSRSIVREDRRGGGISRGLIEFGMAHVMQYGCAVLIGGCVPEHLPMYARYGFHKLNDGPEHFEAVGQLAHTLICRTDVLPEPTSSHIAKLVCAMRTGVSEHSHELGRESKALFRLSAPRRARRRTMEW
jgi:predicted GNAT family N-acyltransferase